MLVGFTMGSEGVPTLQADQLNVISYQLNNINDQENGWKDKASLAWPAPINSDKVIKEKIKSNKLKFGGFDDQIIVR